MVCLLPPFFSWISRKGAGRQSKSTTGCVLACKPKKIGFWKGRRSPVKLMLSSPESYASYVYLNAHHGRIEHDFTHTSIDKEWVICYCVGTGRHSGREGGCFRRSNKTVLEGGHLPCTSATTDCILSNTQQCSWCRRGWRCCWQGSPSWPSYTCASCPFGARLLRVLHLYGWRHTWPTEIASEIRVSFPLNRPLLISAFLYRENKEWVWGGAWRW